MAVVYYSELELRSTGVIAYSLSKYCLNKAVDGNEMQNLAAATAMYGYYANAYFSYRDLEISAAIIYENISNGGII